MRKTFVASVVLAILYCPLVRAEEQLPPPITVVAGFLQLSPEQVAALLTIMQTRDAALQPIAAKLHANQEALGKLVESPDANPAAVGRLLLDIRAAQKQAETIARDAGAAFERNLTPEQRDRLQFVRQAAQIEPVIPAFRAVGLLP
ncbi:MAG TPA: periplasmic heavy metal sensor [Thermoanaerobaculia bacterium]|nr:periplasmic heavy metal sensor [Thermoanaerobaculia bacterium]